LILISFSSGLNSASPVTSSALRSLASAAAKASARLMEGRNRANACFGWGWGYTVSGMKTFTITELKVDAVKIVAQVAGGEPAVIVGGSKVVLIPMNLAF